MDEPNKELSNVRQLSREQRRVLGVLIEKGCTTPEYYPMTLKALIAGCNQRSNRLPIVSYSESVVLEAIDGLTEYGLVAVVHTSGGRTERYRHYMRHKFDLSEEQLAILTELWLRGGQQLGELRTRASRMRPIASQDELRHELASLIEKNFVHASGPLDRRGIEVDHTFYQNSESRPASPPAKPDSTPAKAVAAGPSTSGAARATPVSTVASTATQSSVTTSECDPRVDGLELIVTRQSDQIQQLVRDLGDLNRVVEELTSMVDDLRQQLGV